MGYLSLGLFASLLAPAGPGSDLAAIVKAYFSASFAADWQSVEKLPGIQWAPLPPNMLQNCLPDGGCFTRQGRLRLAGGNFLVIATGARTIVNSLYVRNTVAPVGDESVLSTLKTLGISVELARCPVPGTAGGTNWYRLKGPSLNAGVLSVQTSCNGKPCEGYVLSQGGDLPALQPAQLKLYSEKCSAPAAERTAVAAAGMPHEQLAKALLATVPALNGPALYDWKTLLSLPAGFKWLNQTPQKAALGFKNDPNPLMLTGQAEYSGRKFSLIASGSPTEVRTIYVEEMGTHPKGEHLLGEIYKQGLQVQLVKCGPQYTASTNNWYSLKGPNNRPALIRQSIQYDGNQVADNYELRLDNTLPKPDPRDRAPGVNGCR